MKQGYCNGRIFKAPSGGEILCTKLNPQVASHARNPEFLDTGDRCKIVCDAAHAIPEYVTCDYTGWNHNDQGARDSHPDFSLGFLRVFT